MLLLSSGLPVFGELNCSIKVGRCDYQQQRALNEEIDRDDPCQFIIETNKRLSPQFDEDLLQTT
jgi:hypothetical protein